MSRETLSERDVARLLADPSAENRSRTAERVARKFEAGGLSDGERRIAAEIFRLMMKDAEVLVREALSRHLKQCPTLPHDVALTLARDVDSVALPMLECSEVLTDEDLEVIVRSADVARQLAVAGRASVSQGLADALADSHDERVVSRLVGNKGAEIAEGTLGRLVDEFGDRESVQFRMAMRANLPITVAERLVARASESMRQQLASRGGTAAGMAAEIMLQARERAVLGLLGDDVDLEDVGTLVRHLDDNHRLTPSIVLRALCTGDLAFFEVAMARLAKVPLENARTLIHDAGPLGLRAIFDRTGLPAALFTALRAGVSVADEAALDGEPHDRERRSRKIIERILTQYGDLGVQMEADDLEYLLARMGQLG